MSESIRSESSGIAEATSQLDLAFRRAVQAAPFPVMVHDETGLILALSHTFTELCGYTPEELPNLDAWADLAFGQRRQEMLATMATQYELTERREDGDLSIATKEGRYRTWTSSSVGLGRLPNGRRIAACSATDVTEIRETIEALSRSEVRYRNLFEMTPYPMYVYEPDSLTFLAVNEAALESYGYSRDEFLSLKLSDIRPPDEIPHLLASLAVSRPDRLFRHLRRDGTEITVEISQHPVELDGFLGSLVVARNVTERVRQERELALWARRAQALLDLPRLAESLDEAGVLRASLRIAKELTSSLVDCIQLRQEPGKAAGAGQYVCSCDQSSNGSSLCQSGAWSEAVLACHHVIDNDVSANTGVQELQRSLVVPVVDGGSVTLLMGVANKPEPYTETDIETVQLIANDVWQLVSRRRHQHKIAQLSRALEQSSHSMIITDLQGNIEYVNPAFLALTGYELDEVIGANSRILASGKTPPETYLEMWTHLQAGKSWRGEFVNERKDGSDFIEFAVISPVRGADGRITHYVAAKEDVTETRQMAQELDRHRNHLQELVEMRTSELAQARAKADAANAAKGRFLAAMSHEIRTPLNAIVGLTHLLGRAGATPEQTQLIEQIDGAGRHLVAIVSDILDQARIEADRLVLEETVFHPTNPLYDVRDLIAGQVQAKQLRIEIEVDQRIGWLTGDPTRIRQALLNFTSNAVKFTKRGLIKLRSMMQEETEDEVLIRYEVEDTGIGISPDALPNLFIAFEQGEPSTSRQYGGSGLGLAITKHLVNRMGGEVGVDSQLGKGSTFFFTARLKKSSAPEMVPDTMEDRLAQHRGARLLVVEDSTINREVLTELLQTVGFLVDSAGNGQEAVEKVRAASYDLVLMDMQMPVMNGLDASRTIRRTAKSKELPIVAMTANAFEEDRRACLDAGMNDFLTKPVEPKTLYSTVLVWLADDEVSARTAEPLIRGATETPIVLPDLDVQTGLGFLGHNMEKYQALLRQFVRSRSGDLSTIKSSECSEVAILAHTLKGAAGTLGAMRIADLASLLEASAKRGEDRPELVRRLELAFEELSRKLDEMEQTAEDGEGSSPPDVVDQTVPVNEVLEQALTMLQRGDARVVDLLYDQRAILEGTMGTQAAELLEMVGLFEFEKSLHILKEWSTSTQGR